MSEHMFRVLMLWAVGAIGVRLYGERREGRVLLQWADMLLMVAFLGLMAFAAVEQWA